MDNKMEFLVDEIFLMYIRREIVPCKEYDLKITDSEGTIHDVNLSFTVEESDDGIKVNLNFNLKPKADRIELEVQCE